MTISTTINVVQYNGNGVTTDFSFPYLFYSDAHLQVFVIDADNVSTLQTINTDYTVTGEGIQSGGTVSMVVAPTSGEKLLVRRVVPLTQLTDYVSGDSFPADAHETALDLSAMGLQQLSEISGRGVVVSGIDAVNEVDPVAQTVIGFDINGDLETFPFTEAGVSVASEITDETRSQSVQQSLDDDKTAIQANATAIQANADELDNVAPNPAVTITGTANALIATPNGTAGPLVDGLRIRGRAIADTLAATTTLNYNGTGDKTVTGVDAAGQLQDELIYEFVYNATTDEWEVDGAIGHGQVWRDETLNRLPDVDYTNTRKRPIVVNVFLNGGAGDTSRIEVDGILVAVSNNEDAIGSTNTFIVPSGSVYRVTDGNTAIGNWAELR